MKRKLQSYAFSKLEIKTLKEIAGENHSLTLLMRNLHIKPNLLSYTLKRLLQKHIIVSEKKMERSRKDVYFADSKHASLLRELLVKYGHVKWENVLSGLGIEVLLQVLNYPEVSFENFSRVTFWRYSKDFMALGILKSDYEGYSINPRFSILVNFLMEYQKFLLDALVSSVSGGAVMLWQKDFECLFRVSKNSVALQNGFLKTATSRLQDFGIPVFSDFDVYLYSKKERIIRMEDVILHTLLIEKNDVRYVTYGLLLLKKALRRINKEYLMKEAQRLDLGLQVNAMLQFLKTKGVRRGLTLPTWAEFIAKAKEYSVGG